MAMKRKLLKRFVTYSILVAALAVAVLAQQPSSTPSVDRLRQVIEYLASDALEGRRTGTPGANDAAHYIAGEFNRYGLRPGKQMARPARTRGENQARYLQPFPYVAGVELGKNNLFFVNRGRPDDAMQFLVGNDWMPVGFSSNGQVEAAPLVFAGYGITDAELKYDDYPSAVKGRIALAFSGTPDGDNPHGKFARYEDVRWKAIAARNAGAKALLVITQETNLQNDRLSRLRYDNSAGDSGIPVAIISRQLAIRLFRENDGEKLGALQTAFRLIISQHLAHGTANFGFGALQDANIIPVANYTLTLSIDIVRREAPSFNFVGLLPGGNPKLKH